MVKVMVELLGAVERISGDVECHNSEIRETADHVGNIPATGEMEVVKQALLGHMVSLLNANKRLQNDLICTRDRMEEQAQEIDHVRREARTDPLTTVANRKAYDEKVRALMAAWERERAGFAVVLVDLDHFKRINDSHGHVTGDRVLEKVGRWLSHWIRDTDFVARYGGDEFILLLPRTELKSGMEIAEQIRLQLAQHASEATVQGTEISLSLSMGVAAVREGDTIESLVHRADNALYASKCGGRNQVHGEEQDPALPLDLGIFPSPVGQTHVSV